jgi:NAD(P)-dependent dehydrogenase (short-subunit alcohol dehydrogenase family)
VDTTARTGGDVSRAPRNVIVSGGTGALGRAVTAAFLAANDRVVVPWIDPGERAEIERAEADALAAKRLELVEADVAEAAGAAAVAAAAGAVDVLVNGVGGFAGGSPVWETELEVWDRLYRMNLRTAVALSRAVLPGMVARAGGSIVNVASEAAITRPAGLAAYSASKGSVLVLTETLQREVVAHGIRVNAVSPSTIDTPANRRAMPDADFSTWTPPASIAGVVLVLASDAASGMRGARIPV